MLLLFKTHVKKRKKFNSLMLKKKNQQQQRSKRNMFNYYYMKESHEHEHDILLCLFFPTYIHIDGCIGLNMNRRKWHWFILLDV